MYGSTRAWLIIPRIVPAMAPDRSVIMTKVTAFKLFFCHTC
jgi:hypothetical protein